MVFCEILKAKIIIIRFNFKQANIFSRPGQTRGAAARGREMLFNIIYVNRMYNSFQRVL